MLKKSEIDIDEEYCSEQKKDYLEYYNELEEGEIKQWIKILAGTALVNLTKFSKSDMDYDTIKNIYQILVKVINDEDMMAYITVTKKRREPEVYLTLSIFFKKEKLYLILDLKSYPKIPY